MTIKNISYIVIATAMTCVANASAAGVTADADSAYAQGRYSEAVELYKEAAAKEGVSTELYYNLGNAYCRAGDYGHALANYERAIRLDPSNQEARGNIDYIESRVADANKSELKGKKLSVERDSPSFFSSLRAFICRDHLSDTWAVWSVVCFVLLMACIAAYIFSRNVLIRKTGFFGGFVFLGISAITMIFALMAASYRTNEGVITGGKVKLRGEPSLSAKESPVSLTRGTRMTILDSIPIGTEHPADWYKVRLNSDFVGWVESSDFEPIGM